MSEENKIRDAADAVKGIVQAVPVYQDVAQPAAKEIGTALQTVAKTIHIALALISGLVWGYEKIKEFVTTSVAKRLEKTPEERIITPPPQIAGPALEALRFTGHEESLREMYGKLLATAMDADSVVTAHPSFVEIIKQLSPDEARICKLFKDKGVTSCFPVINLIGTLPDGNYRDVVQHYSRIGFDAGCERPLLIQRYLDNLVRLGIVEIPNDSSLANSATYEALENDPKIQGAKELITKEGLKPQMKHHYVSTTSFGIMFIEACVD